MTITKYHRDGTVTFWSVYLQQWRRVAAERISDADLVTLSNAERLRIGRMATEAGR